MDLPSQTAGLSEEDFQSIWSRVILKPDIKERIISAVRLFNSGDPVAPRGLLLVGPPSVGKTLISRCIADSIDAPFLNLGYADIRRPHDGSRSGMQSVWEKARSLGRCVIRIDEIDYLLAARGNPDSDALTSDVVGDFMVGFDSAQRDRILIVGEAFTEDAIDPSVVARCSVVILPLPDAHERRKILLLELRKLQCESLIPEFVIPALGSVSGRDLANLAHQILSKAGDCKAITPEVWQEAVAEFVGRRS